MKKHTKTRKEVHEDFWDESLQLSNEIKEKGPVSRNLQSLLALLINKIDFKTVAEVGCGQGARLGYVKKMRPNAMCSGLDISKTAIAGAKKNYPAFAFEVLDIEQDSSRKKYDLVLCMDVVEHVKDDKRALKNIRKMTKKYLILSTIQGRMRTNEGPEGHLRNYKYSDLINKIKGSGFNILEVIEWGYPFYSPIYRDILEISDRYTKKTDKKMRSSSLVTSHTSFLLKYFGEILYQIMKLSSSSRGDYIYILAEVK